MMNALAIALLGAALMAMTSSASAAVPRPEYPRPDFERDAWLNLNGQWQFEIDQKGDGEARGLTSGHDLPDTITVPFCPESKLSGIHHTGFMVHVWYRRRFEVPAAWAGKRVLLHFGAVDWWTRVWVNGKLVGEHKGGYSPFVFEITKLIKKGPNELVVQVYDDTASGKQATGKQCHALKSEGCLYTRTTGIWQTVWLEAVGQTYLREVSLRPDLDGGRVFVRGWIDGPSEGVKLRARAYAGGKLVGEMTIPAEWRAAEGVLKLSEVKAWWPGKPFLYSLTLDLLRDGKVEDTVHSYFGLRKISIQGNRFLINDKPIFQRLVLDQGFYPDGIYTAPTDEALKHDIQLSMEAGFNGARLHQKVFDPRFLYWADKLGFMVWGEYPSWGVNWADPEAVGNVVNEWREVVERDRNHPSIIGWCPLNETSGDPSVAAVEEILATTQVMDPTRPFLDTSGYTHLYPGTDVYDCHDYDQNPVTFEARYHNFSMTGTDPFNNNLRDPRSAYRGQPFFVSEYGGIFVNTGVKQKVGGWGYGQTSVQGFLKRYKGLTDVLLDDPNMCGFCYTQLTDIEQEQNGVYFYDRRPKYDPRLLAAINEQPAAYETQPPRIRHITWTTLVPSSRYEGQQWRYTTEKPAAGWMKPGFDDSAWKTGKGGFGTKGTPGAVVRTVWNTSDIWLRRKFEVSAEALKFSMAGLDIHHDEDAEVYINGKKVATFANFVQAYFTFEATDALRKALVAGENTIAVHCHQTVGGQYIDVGIKVGVEEKE